MNPLTKKETSQNYISSPHEIHLKVLLTLSIKDIAQYSLVCHAFENTASDKHLWKSLCLRDLEHIHKIKKDWKKTYQVSLQLVSVILEILRIESKIIDIGQQNFPVDCTPLWININKLKGKTKRKYLEELDEQINALCSQKEILLSQNSLPQDKKGFREIALNVLFPKHIRNLPYSENPYLNMFLENHQEASLLAPIIEGRGVAKFFNIYSHEMWIFILRCVHDVNKRKRPRDHEQVKAVGLWKYCEKEWGIYVMEKRKATSTRYKVKSLRTFISKGILIDHVYYRKLYDIMRQKPVYFNDSESPFQIEIML
ncbi:MAG: hypothetical protein K940chlam3_01254 [Chlamydiae bacterium]|nr:hypothetical protein [Chlamydiota bacterium]